MRKAIKTIKCWLQAIPFFLKSGEWTPHIYTCDYEKAIIIADKNSFRVSEGFDHEPGETVYNNACLITYTCKDCGHKTYAWYHSWAERFRLGV